MKSKLKLIKTYKGFRIYKFFKVSIGEYNKIHANERYYVKEPWKFLFWTVYLNINVINCTFFKLVEFYSEKGCKEFIKDYIRVKKKVE